MRRYMLRIGVVTLGALIMLAASLVPMALASPNATYTVTKTADTYDGTCDADCSLREAIGAANLAPGSTVVVPAGTYVLSRAGYNEDNNSTGDLDILANLTITSATGVKPSLQAAGGLLDRVIQTMTGTQVTLNNVLIYNGTSNVGGGLYALGDLTLNSVYIVSNTASWGGGLFIDGHALTMTGSVVWQNTATVVGGGIASQDGPLFISNSLILSNTITGLAPGSGYGGGLAAMNSATQTIASRLTVINSSVYSNTTPNTTASGAGIYGGGHITLTNVSVYANQSGGTGGGLSTVNPSATVIISGGNFMTNTALGNGGGGFINYATLIMTNTLIQSNTASGGGGFINNNGVMTVTGAHILSNTATNSAISGGGIRSFNYLRLNGVNIRYNQALNGGSGGGLVASNLLSVTGGLIANNTADSNGGGVSIQVGTATFDQAAILTNTALYGGGLSNGGTVYLINGSALNGNTGFQGGGAYNAGILYVNSSRIISNGTTPSCLGCSSGGGVFNNNVLRLTDAIVAANRTDNGSGAGIMNKAVVYATRSAIISNTAGVGHGGGISNTSIVSLTNVTLSGNAANGDGGGLANTNLAQLAYVTLANNTADNDANGSGLGGGVANTGVLTVTGTIIGNNQVKTGSTADCSGALSSGDYNVLETLTGCAFTPLAHDYTNVDPALDLLTNLSNTYVHPLQLGSVAINHGSPTCLATDQRGVARPIGSACDIGAFESAFLDPQTITFNAIPDHLISDAPFVVTATASSGLSVTITSLTTGVCTISSNLVTLIDTGTCTLRAAQAGNAIYEPAPNVDRSFNVKQTQTISFAPLPDRLVSDPPFAITATASSGLSVSLTASGVCNINGTQVTLTGLTGTCTITATQAGDPVYMPAPDVARTFTVKQGQMISFDPLPDRLISDPPFSITATATSGLSVTLNAGGVCSINGMQVTLTGVVGTCTITATQAGNAIYAAAPNVVQSFAVKQSQTISFAPLPNRLVDDPPFIITATASSGLAITFKAQGVCDVVGNEVTLDSNVGVCQLTAYQDGNATYAAAASVMQEFTVQMSQTITFEPLPDRRIDATPFNVAATASSTMMVTFTASGACTSTGVNGAQIDLTALGNCTVTAHQAGNDEYTPAPDVARTFKVTGFMVFLPVVLR